MRTISILLCAFLLIWRVPSRAQGIPPVDRSQLGAWYMYFYQAKVSGDWGVQGDVQYRNYDLGGDLEQLLLRSGATFRHNNLLYTLGYAYVRSSAFGLDSLISTEHRIYQEARFSNTHMHGVLLGHRIRLEQRSIGDQSIRGRFRYMLTASVALGDASASRWHINLYNELFLNARLGPSATDAYFDRNRLYMALGFSVSSKVQLQLGVMNQSTSSLSKNQLQLGLIHKL